MKKLVNYEVAMILAYFGIFFTGIGLDYLLIRILPDAKIIVVGILAYLFVSRIVIALLKIYYKVEEEES